MQANLFVSTIPPPPEWELGTVSCLSIVRAWGKVLTINSTPTFLRHFVPGAEDTKMNEKDGRGDLHSLDPTVDGLGYKGTAPMRAGL